MCSDTSGVAVPTACEDVLKPYASQHEKYMQQPLMPQIIREPLMMYVKMLALQRRADLESDQAVGLARGLQGGDGRFSSLNAAWVRQRARAGFQAA